MDLPLDPTQCRILGVLLEKQLATPEYYPLTLNALLAGCNQKNNRLPVTAYQDFELEGALRSLYVKKWVTNTNVGGRSIKWLHRVDDLLGLDRAQKAVLSELLLRGPQQPGELRAHASRMAPGELETQDALQQVVERLARLVPPLATTMARRPGERAERYAHLLGGEVADAPTSPPLPVATCDAGAPVEPPAPMGLERRMAEAEARLEAVENELEKLRRELRGPSPA